MPTSAGPWDSPEVNQRSMGGSFHVTRSTAHGPLDARRVARGAEGPVVGVSDSAIGTSGFLPLDGAAAAPARRRSAVGRPARSAARRGST